MNSESLSERFRDVVAGEGGRDAVSVTIRELVDASSDGAEPRLWLPSIQRSLVWDNKRLVHFWDSLFRGYPVGTMLVHAVDPKISVLSVETHQVDRPALDDLSLFDGQQRLHALRLGFNRVKEPIRRLWIDLGRLHEHDPELSIPLRISGPGQPFGYDAKDPNSKHRKTEQRTIPDGRRERGADTWNKSEDLAAEIREDRKNDPTVKSFLIGSIEAVPLWWLFDKDRRTELENAGYEDLLNKASIVDQIRLLLISVPKAIVKYPNEYRRFFDRVGRGGMALSDKELAYSIIKQHLPHVRARMEAIRGAGRIVDEVDLVLGCLRIARTVAGESDSQRRAKYPRSEDLARFGIKEDDDATRLFMRLIPHEIDDSQKGGYLLQTLMRELIDSLTKGENGLPPMLLPHLDGELWQVLLLVRFLGQQDGAKQEDDAQFVAFTLWWLLFVEKGYKAASLSFERACDDSDVTLAGLARFIRDTRPEMDARTVLAVDTVHHMVDTIAADDSLHKWGERYDGNSSLQQWASTDRVRRRALLWLQRLDPAVRAEGYDPSSDRDDDLPIEFDHLIPRSKWQNGSADANWPLSEVKIFRDSRRICGDSIGNFRILSDVANESRGNTQLAVADVCGPDFGEDGESWITLSARPTQDAWSRDEAQLFQRLVQQRSLRLYAQLVRDSGIADLLGESV